MVLLKPSQTIEFRGVRPDDKPPIRKRHLSNMHPTFATPTAECRRRHLQFQGQLYQPPLVRLVEARVDGSIPARPLGETLAREHRPHGPRVECVPAVRRVEALGIELLCDLLRGMTSIPQFLQPGDQEVVIARVRMPRH